MYTTIISLAVMAATAMAATTTTSAVASPTASGTVSNCNKFYKIASGDTCNSIIATYGNTFTLSQFDSWNPSVNSACSNLIVGYNYCVGISTATSTSSSSKTTSTTSKSSTTTSKSSTTSAASTTTPSPVQSGIPSDCTKYYQALTGDNCTTVDVKYDITRTQFGTWNPAINVNCTNLLAGYYYCVAVGSTTTTSSTTTSKASTTSTTLKTTTTTSKASTTSTTKTSTSSTSTTSPPPSPTQSGIVSNCDKYYQVSSGDSCSTIEAAYSITSAQFLSWNTGINSACTDLWAGYYCCVGVSA